MSEKLIKNIEFATVLPLADQVSYMPGQIVSKTLVQNKSVSMTLFAFDKDEEISAHDSDGDAMVIVLDGKGEITIENEKFELNAGDSIIMPSKKMHSVYATQPFKMLLVVVFPQR